ncbi:MAG: DUF2799 domain-containing protein [Cohaesibacter sp.]|nr:DUF2799 domain-containing protein [Cohaesibacter sp.]
MRFIYPLCLGLFLLGGCASLSEEDCQITDWYKLGESDAREGYTDARLSDHIKSCKRYAIAPDLQRYEEGRAAGLSLYCTPDNGFRIGRLGYRYHNICPVSLEEPFLGAYGHGSGLHRIELDIASAQQERNDLQQDVSALDFGKNLNESERRKQRLDLSRQIRRLEREIRRLERERDRGLIASEHYLTQIEPEA